MTILSLVLEPNTYSILIKNDETNTLSSTGINVNKQTKILYLGLVPQPWIKTLDHYWNYWNYENGLMLNILVTVSITCNTIIMNISFIIETAE